MAWRDTLRVAKARVHLTMRVRAAYLLRANAVGVTVHVRVRHKAEDATVDGIGGLAKMASAKTSLVFDLAEVPAPMTNAIVLISEEEAYQLGAVSPPYLGFADVDAVRLPANRAAALWATGLPVGFLAGA